VTGLALCVERAGECRLRSSAISKSRPRFGDQFCTDSPGNSALHFCPSPTAALSQAPVAERLVALPPEKPGERPMANLLPFFPTAAFDHNATRAMGKAFDRACHSLHDIGQPDLVREIIATRIVEVARDGERDPDELCVRALKALGFSSFSNRQIV
jgi:hypothetical protein